MNLLCYRNTYIIFINISIGVRRYQFADISAPRTLSNDGEVQAVAQRFQ